MATILHSMRLTFQLCPTRRKLNQIKSSKKLLLHTLWCGSSPVSCSLWHVLSTIIASSCKVVSPYPWMLRTFHSFLFSGIYPVLSMRHYSSNPNDLIEEAKLEIGIGQRLINRDRPDLMFGMLRRTLSDPAMPAQQKMDHSARFGSAFPPPVSSAVVSPQKRPWTTEVKAQLFAFDFTLKSFRRTTGWFRLWKNTARKGGLKLAHYLEVAQVVNAASDGSIILTLLSGKMLGL